jgi:FtsP/CotA-like multicopper oxidase with cupredoxin domain
VCAREGDAVEVTIHNELPTIVSFHAHGLAFAPDSDGTYHTGSFAMPGGAYTYRYQATTLSVGTWAYHDSVAELDEAPFVHDRTIPESGEGIERGLYGAIVVYARDEPIVDHEVLLAMGDVGPEVSRSGTFEVFNGKVAPLTPTIYAEEGERVRFRLINAGPNDPHDFIVTGHVLRNAHTGETIDGARIEAGEQRSVVLGALTFGDYTLTAGSPGAYEYLCLFGHHASHGMRGAFVVLPKE